MRIRLVAPVKPTEVSGNGVTRDRWAGILTRLGHDLDVAAPDDDEPEEAPADVLVALHARRSAAAVASFRRRHPDRPIVLALTGTDLYRDLARDESARWSVAAADRLVVLQPRAVAAVPAAVRERVVVIRQSLAAPDDAPSRPGDHLAVLVMAHLREVKDPLLTARAVRRLSTDSRIRVRHLGAALDADLAAAARDETATNPRYAWEGEVPRDAALRTLAGSHLLVLTSRLEGGANVVSEAIVSGVPVLSTRIDGSVGMLGEDYPGLFPVGDHVALAELLRRAEDDPGFSRELELRIRDLQPAYRPARERQAWAELLASLQRPPRDGPTSARQTAEARGEQVDGEGEHHVGQQERRDPGVVEP